MTQHESDRADRIAQIKRLGTEFDGQTTGRVQQWADMLQEWTPVEIGRVVDRILNQPERRFLPHIGEIKAMLPKRENTQEGFQGRVNRGEALFWNWVFGFVVGDLDRLPEEKRVQEAARALVMYPPSCRDDFWFRTYIRPMVLAFDPRAFERGVQQEMGGLS